MYLLLDTAWHSYNSFSVLNYRWLPFTIHFARRMLSHSRAIKVEWKTTGSRGLCVCVCVCAPWSIINWGSFVIIWFCFTLLCSERMHFDMQSEHSHSMSIRLELFLHCISHRDMEFEQKMPEHFADHLRMILGHNDDVPECVYGSCQLIKCHTRNDNHRSNPS